MFLEVLGLPKLNICDLVIGRLPICVFSAPRIVFKGAGLAEAEYLCRRSWQTAYLRFASPPTVFSEVLGLPRLSICVDIFGRLPLCIFSAPKWFLQVLGLPN